MASSGKKGKKTKGKTIALTEFLADPGSSSAPVNRFPTRKSSNWADDVENDTDFHHDSRKDKVVLPTAPRATLGTEVDDSKIPKNPPFLAYISNVPYEMDEDEIAAFFKDLKILSVRLPKDEQMGKFKGFGYVEFENRASLISALSMPDTTIKSRRMRIDVADNLDNDRRRGGRDMMRGDMGRDRPDGPDRTLGDWRSGPREDPPPDSERDRGSGFRDRDGGGGGGGGGGFRDREGRYQMADNWDNRPRGGRDRPDGPERSTGDWRSGQREDPPPSDSEREGGFDRGGRSGGRREFGSGGFRDNFGDRERGGGFRDNRDNFGDRDRERGRFGGDREGFERGSGFGDRDRRGGDRDFGGGRDFGGPRRNYSDSSRDGGGYRGGRDDGPPERGGEPVDPMSRPKLNLAPRTKPVEETAISEPSMPAPASVPSGAPTSIFGGAKPVNTAAREREIEERLAREKGEVLRPPIREERVDDMRSKSGSEHGDQEDDNVHGSVPPSRRVEPVAPPSENYWMQRTQQTQSSRSESSVEDNGHVSPHSEHQEHREPQRRYQDRPESPRRGNEDEYDDGHQSSRGPPRGAYEREDRGGRDEIGGRDDRGGRGPSGLRGSGGGPVRGGDRQRGRGEGRPMSERDHRRDVGPDDPNRMPKYRESETPNFAASNKFASLHSDNEQSNGSD